MLYLSTGVKINANLQVYYTQLGNGRHFNSLCAMFNNAPGRLRWKGITCHANCIQLFTPFKPDGERQGLISNDELELDYRTIAVDEGVDLYPAKKAPAAGRLIADSSSEEDESLYEYS